MRVLVEQTYEQVERSLRSLGLLWSGTGDHQDKVGVNILMGGADDGDWALYPEHCAVIIGTQDMLLSRAMNRGYGAPRARWPMEFGLLSQDSLWVMDEVQLMDVGLATSAQLQAFRMDDEQAGKSVRHCFTWWMSATLQPNWLRKSPDTEKLTLNLPETRIAPKDRIGHLWDDVGKPCRIRSEIASSAGIADLSARLHLGTGRGKAGPTLVVLNTAERAVEVWRGLKDNSALKGTDIRLVHSRFRPRDRSKWREDFLNRQACAPGTDRIIVATQVIEAGVDLSAGLLLTELAPWASLVQRFGRCARWGGNCEIHVIDLAAAHARKAVEEAAAKSQNEKAKGKKPKPFDEAEIASTARLKVAPPYDLKALDAARIALALVSDVAPLHLEAFEDDNDGLLPALYPFEPLHLLLRHEVDELFDTTPDLSGADVDISRFIRSGDERDLQVFWADVPKGGTLAEDFRPSRDALCAVPFLKARDWLFGNETASAKPTRLKKGMRAWLWDWQEGAWRRPERRDLYPGQLVAVAADCGGYNAEQGWAAEIADPVSLVASHAEDLSGRADSAQNDESLSVHPWKTIATHGQDVAKEAASILKSVAPSHVGLFELAGRCHDIGKCHEAFSGSINKDWPDRPARQDLAKAPKEAWLSRRKLYPMPDGTRRDGFRHELATVLALFAIFQRHMPDHDALLGPWRELLERAGMAPQIAYSISPATPPTPLEKEILSLNSDCFDLLAYVVCAHHGKLRVAWHPGREIGRAHV
jgi:CRISPR-associated endonuclease/helicase Cas3